MIMILNMRKKRKRKNREIKNNNKQNYQIVAKIMLLDLVVRLKKEKHQEEIFRKHKVSQLIEQSLKMRKNIYLKL